MKNTNQKFVTLVTILQSKKGCKISAIHTNDKNRRTEVTKRTAIKWAKEFKARHGTNVRCNVVNVDNYGGQNTLADALKSSIFAI